MTGPIRTDLLPAPKTPSARLRAKRRLVGALLLLLALLAVAGIALLKWQTAPVPRREVTEAAARVQVHTLHAAQRNQNAVELFQLDLEQMQEDQQRRQVEVAAEAAAAAATAGNCLRLVALLVQDQWSGERAVEAHLQSLLGPHVDPFRGALEADVAAAVDKLERELRRSTLQLANDLAALGPGRAARDPQAAARASADLQQGLRNLGFNAAGLGGSLVFDAVAVAQSSLRPLLAKQLAALAGRRFAGQAATVAASAAAAAADGPLPIGDILAVAGLAWTAYDGYASLQAFERDVNTAVNNQLAETQSTLHKQALERAKLLLKHYQRQQETLGREFAGL